MAIYATKQDLEDRDGSMLYNFALDRSTDTLNDTWIDEALATADDEINGYLSRRFVLPLPTYPIFADTPKGRQLHGLWDPGMRTLIRQGKLAEIYRQNKLYDYYQDFLREQVVRANKPQP